MTLAPGDLYWKKTRLEIDWFIELMDEFPMLDFYHPNPVQAPWHVQCKLPSSSAVINIWPHTWKVHMDEYGTKRGADGFRELILAAYAEPEPRQLINDEGDDIPF